MATPGYRILWQYRVKPGEVERFLEHYGPEGSWARLFREAAGYGGTTLLQDATDDRVFLTVDTWMSAEDQRAFLEQFASQYQELDEACEALVEWERQIGHFARVSKASETG